MRAATLGRVLVLEGIEKAERNVLPVLNNLMENREMQLEDGRFLLNPSKYDSLLLVSTGGSTRALLARERTRGYYDRYTRDSSMRANERCFVEC